MRTVFVIDDNPEVLHLLSSTITAENVRVATFSNPKHAVIRAALDKPDAVICDFKMPGLNGFEVYNQINKNPFEKPIPLVLLSGIEFELTDLEDMDITYVSKGAGYKNLISHLNTYVLN